MPLLEREEALSTLDEQHRLAIAGAGRLVFLAGEAGIGKTSLLRAFAAVPSRAANVHWGASDALQTPRPLAPLHDVAPNASTALASLLWSGAARTHVFPAFLEWLSRRPVVVIFEDLHWADEATLDLLRYSGRRIGSTRSLLLATYRDDEVGPGHPLRLVLGDLASCGAPRLSLQRLSVAAVHRLVEDRPVDADELHRATGGNPFYVTEVLAAPGDRLPASVRDAVIARAARLGPSARAVLDAAAVAGPRVEPRLLEPMVAAESDAVRKCLDSGVLVAQDEFLAFRHELARQAILDAMTPTRRLALHRLALESLRHPGLYTSDPARLAHHAEAAGDAAALLEFAPAAARDASARGGHREAAAQWRRALCVSSLGAQDRAAMLDSYAAECHLCGQLEDAIAARQSAISLWQAAREREREATSRAQLAMSYVVQGRNDDADAAIQSALSTLPSDAGLRAALEVRSAHAYLRMLDRDCDTAILEGGRALQDAESLGDGESVSRCLNTLGAATIVGSRVEEGVQLLERSLEIAHSLSLDSAVANALGNLGSGCGEMYRFDLAERYLKRGVEYCSDRDLDHSRNYQRAWLALVEMYLGRWTEAAASAHAVLADGRASAIARMMALIALGRVRARRGDPGVWEALDEARELAMLTGTLQRAAPTFAARAEAAWLEGRAADAQAEAAQGAKLAIGRRHRWFASELLAWQSCASEAAGGGTVPEFCVGNPFVLEMQGDTGAAVAAWRGLGCPYETARALALGDESSQREALEILDTLGAGPLAERVRRQLRVAGARGVKRGPRSVTQRNVAGLTQKEFDVLVLLCEGLRNKDIAQRLHRSVRTVDHHVAAIIEKLGAGNRAEVVSVAHRRGLVHGGAAAS